MRREVWCPLCKRVTEQEVTFLSEERKTYKASAVCQKEKWGKERWTGKRFVTESTVCGHTTILTLSRTSWEGLCRE